MHALLVLVGGPGPHGVRRDRARPLSPARVSARTAADATSRRYVYRPTDGHERRQADCQRPERRADPSYGRLDGSPELTVHDARDLRDVVGDELVQRLESGHDVAGLRPAVDAALRDGSEPALLDVLRRLERAPVREDWPHEEPSDLAGILATLEAPAARPARRARRRAAARRPHPGRMARPLCGLHAGQAARGRRAARGARATWSVPGRTRCSTTCRRRTGCRRACCTRRGRRPPAGASAPWSATTTSTTRSSRCTSWIPTASATRPRTWERSG